MSSTAVTREQTLNSQVIQVLCAGMQSTKTILNHLETRFPQTNWTGTLLARVLSKGTAQGRYTKLTGDHWMLRKDMVRVYPQNQIYQFICDAITPEYAFAGMSCGPG